MKRLLILALSLLALMSCAAQKQQPAQVIIRDSIVFRDRVIHDTTKVEIPVIIEKNVTRDTVSHLENPYAKSDASVSDGLLSHSLETKHQVIYVPVETHVTDTLIIQKPVPSDPQVIKEYIEKPLNWWQKFRLKAFWWLALAFSGLLVWTFREPLKNLVKKYLPFL